MVSAQFPIDHFTHIFIDEAGHAMEPESLVAIAGEGFEGAASMPHMTSGPTICLSPHHSPLSRVDGSQRNRQPRRAAGAGRGPSAAGACASLPAGPEARAGVLTAGAAAHLNGLYKTGPDGYNPQFITKLLRNYRYPTPSASPAVASIPQSCCSETIQSKKTVNWRVSSAVPSLLFVDSVT